MAHDQRVEQAAVIADRWSMDITRVLAEEDPFLWAVRVAGHVALNRMEKQANDTARKG